MFKKKKHICSEEIHKNGGQVFVCNKGMYAKCPVCKKNVALDYKQFMLDLIVQTIEHDAKTDGKIMAMIRMSLKKRYGKQIKKEVNKDEATKK